MKTVTFTEFRKRASTLITEVEHGEILIVLRHGRAVAEISPVNGSAGSVPTWEMPGLRLAGSGSLLSDAILEERESAD